MVNFDVSSLSLYRDILLCHAASSFSSQLQEEHSLQRSFVLLHNVGWSSLLKRTEY